MLIRVFEIPPPTGNFHFEGGEVQPFVEVDWFRDDGPGTSDFATAVGQNEVRDFIKAKRYFRPEKAYLVLHPTHPFTIGYSAP